MRSVHQTISGFTKVLQIKSLALVFYFCVLTSCNIIKLDFEFDQDADIHKRIISQQQDRFPDYEPLEISNEIRTYMDRLVDNEDSDEIKVEKIQTLLFDEKHLNIQYSDDATRTAIQVFTDGLGNCLSVMNLYVAVARYVGLDAEFQTVDVQPSWDRRGGLLVLNQHINATGRLSVRRRYVVDFTPELALQQLTSNRINDQKARALYFNNLGVEALIAGQPEESLVFFQNALWLDNFLSIGWNNIGTAYKLLGQIELSEYSYQMAFETDNSNATAVNNLARFYNSQGNERKAAEYTRAIRRFNEKNPYYHFALGNLAFSNSDFLGAREYFRKALRLKEVEPDFHLALARTYQMLGKPDQAQRLTSSARELLASDEIYQPSDQKVRIIDSSFIRHKSSPGITIIAPGLQRPAEARER